MDNTTSPETVQETQPQATHAPEQTTPVEQPMVVDASAPEVQLKYADKFDSVSDLESSYKELQSTFSKKMGDFTGAPEAGYNVDFAEWKLTDSQNSMTDQFRAWGQENNLSEDGYIKLVDNYARWDQENYDTQVRETYEALGENADYRIRNINDYLTANLSEDQVSSFGDTLRSAKAIEAFESLIKKTQQSPVQAPVSQVVSADQVHAARFKLADNGDRLMSVDPAYRAKVLEMESRLNR